MNKQEEEALQKPEKSGAAALPSGKHTAAEPQEPAEDRIEPQPDGPGGEEPADEELAALLQEAVEQAAAGEASPETLAILQELLGTEPDQAALRNEQRARAALADIRRLDPTVTGWEDIAARDTDRRFYELVFGKGLDEVSAYKLAFFDRLLEGREAASRQAALNGYRGLAHLAPTGGSADTGPQLTDEELAEWKAYGFTEAQAKQFKSRFAKNG